MIEECTNFNQDLSDWDISKVTDMEGMFAHCSSFNQDLSTWDVSQVNDMGWLFDNCSSLKYTQYWNLHPDCVAVPEQVKFFPDFNQELKLKIISLLKECTLSEAVNQVLADPTTSSKERYELLKFQQSEISKELGISNETH